MAQDPGTASEAQVARGCAKRECCVFLSPRLILLSTGQSLEQNPLLRKQSSNSSVCYPRLSGVSSQPAREAHQSFLRIPPNASIPSLLYASHTSALVFTLPKAVTETSIFSPHNFLYFNTKAMLKIWLPGHRLPRPFALASSDTFQSPMLSNFLQ